MDKQQARNLIKETFENPFNKARFTAFTKNLLNRIEEAPFTYQGQFIPDAYKPYISVLERIGKNSDGEHKIDILNIKLKKETSLERARTMQRNFVAWYLNGSRGGELKDAALVAFIAPDETEWRFSLVKMDYKFEQSQTGKIKVKEEFTPARRWSFLVGVNEKSHTVQSRLVPILSDDVRYPSLAQLEEAFNIETVTKEFFLKYRDLFIRTKEELDKVVKYDAQIKADFEAKGVDTVNFAKKLLGQIVFLYFLQKKGWFGARRDANWGEGAKQFLRELFERRHGNYNNFLNDILEPLFYEALRNDRCHDDDYYSRFNCKIPFLNGGLFDPIGNYDWVHTDIILPDILFSNKNKTREGDIGDGILDVFDRYNFTVKEDEPLEKEVAIDPELLGKAYEKFNAIRPDNFDEYKKVLKSGKKGDETKFNKEFGVYYTPREIVHYMCQQSLINYLVTEMEGGVRKEDIETLIYLGEHVGENEEIALIKQQKILEGEQKSSDYKLKLPESIRKNAALIDQKLSDITVCDPAVGSGAFPVGMMSEVVRARTVLSTFIDDKTKRTTYNFKRQCIEHSLYGVDIDPGAVEIAKLRLWLSLVVDEEDIKNIKPLPNLDYKIVCGDSLLGYPYTPTGLEKIEKLKELFIKEVNPTRKNELRSQIDDAIYGLFKNTEQSLGYKVTMDFKINFSEVFGAKDGFDVVIANPPYGVSIKDDDRKAIVKQLGKVPDYEIYYYFIEKAFSLLSDNGTKSYVIPNTILFNTFAKRYRESLLAKWDICEILDCSDFIIFENVTVRNVITLFKKSNYLTFVGYRNSSGVLSFNELISKHRETILKEDLLINNQNWSLSFKVNKNILDLTNRVKKSCRTLYDYFPNISQGLIAYDKYQGQSEEVIKNRVYHSFEKKNENYKPWLWGEDITRYLVRWNGKEYINYCDGIANPRKPIFFKGERILVREITNPSIYAGYTDNELYNDPAVIIILKGSIVNLFCLLGILNSTFASFYHFNTAPKAIKGAFPKILVEDIQLFPLPDKLENYETQIPLIKTVDKILLLTQSSDYLQSPAKQAQVKECEQQIDQMVYELYGLTPEEIAIAEGSNKK